MPETSTFNERVYALVRRVPSGRVITYGLVALILQAPQGARAVGWALSALPTRSTVPWQRVVNSKRQISPRGDDHTHLLQRSLLEGEGIVFEGETIPIRFFLSGEAELLSQP
ncbi:MAG TPA: MGMT family protein [Aggregatilineales bacterium]|nr:MGMT family protein [Anaerolineales bacterium]HRE48783.1 MGMT family protein [Aggregatilineales bacterium]